MVFMLTKKEIIPAMRPSSESNHQVCGHADGHGDRIASACACDMNALQAMCSHVGFVFASVCAFVLHLHHLHLQCVHFAFASALACSCIAFLSAFALKFS